MVIREIELRDWWDVQFLVGEVHLNLIQSAFFLDRCIATIIELIIYLFEIEEELDRRFL